MREMVDMSTVPPSYEESIGGALNPSNAPPRYIRERDLRRGRLVVDFSSPLPAASPFLRPTLTPSTPVNHPLGPISPFTQPHQRVCSLSLARLTNQSLLPRSSGVSAPVSVAPHIVRFNLAADRKAKLDATNVMMYIKVSAVHASLREPCARYLREL